MGRLRAVYHGGGAGAELKELTRSYQNLVEAVVTHSTADYEIVAGQPVRRRRAPLTRGLNPTHNRVLKNVFKGAATAARTQPGPLQDWYHGVLARGGSAELATVTLARKLAAITLRLWKQGAHYDPAQLTTPAR